MDVFSADSNMNFNESFWTKFLTTRKIEIFLNKDFSIVSLFKVTQIFFEIRRMFYMSQTCNGVVFVKIVTRFISDLVLGNHLLWVVELHTSSAQAASRQKDKTETFRQYFHIKIVCLYT